ATWIYNETAKNITWSYSGIPTDRNLKFRYGAWNNTDNRWVNFAHVAVTQASGTGTGYQTAGTTNLGNIDKPAVVRVVLVDANYNESQINGAIVQARAGSQSFTIKTRGVPNTTVESSSLTTQTEMFQGQTGVETVRADVILSVNAVGGDVFINPNGTNIVVKNSAGQEVSLSSSDITKWGLLRINGVDSTSSSVSQFVRDDTDGFGIYRVRSGQTEKFHVRLTFKKSKLTSSGQYSSNITGIKVGQIDGVTLNNQTVNLAIAGTVQVAAATISGVNIQDNQATWIYNETAKNITWSYSGIPTDRNLKFRYGAWNTVDNRWINYAHVAVTQASGTGTGYQTAGTTNLSNINKAAVVRVVLLDSNYNEYPVNGAIVQARSSQTFTIKRRGVASVTLDSSSLTSQTEMFNGQAGTETVRADAIISVSATNGDVYIKPYDTEIVVKNSAGQAVSLLASDISKLGSLRINGVDQTSTSVSQYVRTDNGFFVFVVRAGQTEKFHLRLTFKKSKLATPGQYSASINSVKIGDLDSTVLSPKTTALNISGTISLTPTPTVWAVQSSVVKGQNLAVDGIDLRGRAITITGLITQITPTYVDITGGVRALLSTTSLVPGRYTLSVAGITGSWNFTVTGPAQSAPTVPRITSVIVEDFPLTWTNRVAANPVTVTYEGLPRGKVIQLYFNSDLNGGSANIPPANDRTTISTSGGFRVNIYPNILDANLLNKEYYVVAKVMNPDGTVYRVNGSVIQATSANRFQIIPNPTASADGDSQLANTETASQSLWDKFVDWLK
ncbi:MAG: hypothetical protein QG665_60, partial [Patescibacteria group bacterium]|nr:hypothetical protein [Patescibacteria group bacterium]